jgi:CubicO group peptidase (beta-lactamase class C family)
MLEKATGTNWEALITERLFKPLHMDSAGFGAPGTTGLVDEPWGHTQKFGSTMPVQLDNPTAIGPAGRVHCSLDDLARYTMFHMQSATSPKLLKPETLARLHASPDGAGYACGWIVTPRPWAGGNALYHNGSNTMWYVIMWLAPNKNFSVVVGTNIYNDGAQKALDDVAVAMIHQWLPEK